MLAQHYLGNSFAILISCASSVFEDLDWLNDLRGYAFHTPAWLSDHNLIFLK